MTSLVKNSGVTLIRLFVLREIMPETTHETKKPDPSRLDIARLKPFGDELLDADSEANTSGAPLPNANNVTP